MTYNPTTLAVSLIKRGIPVFPCRAADEIDETTGEIYCAKSPLTSNGLSGATKIERLVRELFKRHDTALVGTPTGRAMGAFVVDIDVKVLDDGGTIDGFIALAALEKEHGKLPVTRTARTPRGGKHYYFNMIDGLRNTSGRIGAGIDTRGEGGFVIAPGSVMADGRAYVWEDESAPIADAPQWLIDLVKPPKYEPVPYTHAPGGNAPYVERAVELELNELASTPQGGRGEALNRAAFNVGTLVGAGALDRGNAESGLMQAAMANGVLAKDGERETRAKIKRGLEAGIRQPRQIPESDYQQDDTPRMDFSRLIANAVKRKEAATVNEAASVNDAVDAAVDMADDAPSEAASAEKPDAIHATAFNWIDPRDLPRREFLYGTHLIRKYVSVTVSPGGIGKTSLTIAEALAMITGRPLLGTRANCPLKVWLFNAEDPRDEMDRRIMAAAKHHGLKPDDLAGRLYLDTGREQELIIATDRKNGVVINVPVVAAIIKAIKENGIDVMILDPFVSTHGVSENDNGAIDKVAKTWARIADECNCAIELIHHVKKVDGREVNIDDSRGAVALVGAARSVRVLNRMTEEQAAKANIKEGRNRYFQVTRGKANMSPNVGDGEWRHLENVGLGNGRGIQSPQDHVGVVIEWHWPTAEDVLQELPDDTFGNVCNLLDNGSYRESIQAGDWAGIAVCRVLGLDPGDDGAKARAKTLIRIWKDEGQLEAVRMKDARGVERPYLKSAGWRAP